MRNQPADNKENIMGWIGTENQLMHTLRVMGADRDEDGKFLIYGSAPVSFMGMGEEYVVGDDTFYSVNGKKANLVTALSMTSYGTFVHVVGA